MTGVQTCALPISYFARVFKQHKGVTPQEYRAQLERQRNKQEEQPKTVYHDRVDFTHGVPLKKGSTPPYPAAD